MLLVLGLIIAGNSYTEQRVNPHALRASAEAPLRQILVPLASREIERR